ncbi:hypothetical protein DFR58_11132 [Anaerobacterium chartisolvens]|uniref:Uncharacterized protein n=1 Tax=Anaerobacterium chartisolvens TaxID=1297424 RepID=A0A369B417_9FIRM|nr:hypothetical protein [Anaerobacterium chartisolvens]RCX16289.1 hypothetical protein DFR58_11132 [Anaerobacterium chartisolvens]
MFFRQKPKIHSSLHYVPADRIKKDLAAALMEKGVDIGSIHVKTTETVLVVCFKDIMEGRGSRTCSIISKAH